jgi:class 3 adenylate cyclase
MNENSIRFKTVSIIGLTILISVFHYTAIHGNLGLHLLHRELFFFPILMAAFWFGMKIGLATSIGISIIYAPHVFLYKDPHSELLTIVSQIFMFNLVGLILGWMVDRQKRKQTEHDFIKETFGKYVDKEVRDEILNGQIPLDGEVKDVTVLFADLRGFAKMVESTKPKEVIMILNEYFKEMSEAIKSHKGLVLQFIGDEIEAVFGAPIPLKDHQRHAVEAALEMRERLSRVNLKLDNQGYDPIKHGIGVHTGQVLAANIGSPDRLSYAMVGDTVNTASRIQELNKFFGTDILISETTKAELNSNIITEKLQPTKAKGLKEPLTLFKIFAKSRITHEDSKI